MAVVSVFVALAYCCLTFRDQTGLVLLRENKVLDRASTENIVIHYDSIFRATSIQEIQHQHHDINGWESGFAYHFFLMDGKVHLTRPINSQSPHAFGFNDNSIAICIHATNIHSIRDRINLWLLIEILKIKYQLETCQVRGHGELPGNKTECPGFDMDSLRSTLL